MYIKLINGQPEKYSISQLRRDNPNVSFPEQPTNDLLADWNVYPYTRPSPPGFEKFAHRLTDGTFEQVEGQWVLPWVVEQLPQDQAESNVRAQRDRLLKDSDWIVAVAYERSEPVPPTWIEYRQQLRDIPQQDGFPENVNWPTEPGL